MWLLGWQVCALACQAAAVWLARADHRLAAEILSDAGLALIYASALWALTVANLDRTTRNVAVLSLGVSTTLFWRATNPLLFTGFDEQLHLRTLADIISSHRLFEANPLLEISPRYPGLEVVTVLVHQIGIPTFVAAYIVILLCRVVLVTVLCDAVEQLTGSAQAGGLAVAVYALSSQFVFFNSQFAYQTMAIPLALAAVSFLARARAAVRPLPFLGGATICLLAVALVHHVTSFLTAGLLVAWAIVEQGHARLRIAYGACAAVAATLAWAVTQRQTLSGYFGPIIGDVAEQFRGGERRDLFKDAAGTVSRSVDQYLLIYYAAALSVVVIVVTVLAYRERHYRRAPLLMVAALSAAIPVFLAARVVPKGGELYDRSNSFLFFPFSMYVAGFAVWFLWRESRQFGFRDHRRTVALRVLGIVMASAAFLGGYVLGSGPSWARLPGPYIPAADTRSMDAETLAAVQWARDGLPAGSRIAADRVSSVLLSAQAGLWPVMQGPGSIDVAKLYVAGQWGQDETDMAAAMRLRYLYVDRRMADQLPPYGAYFYEGDSGEETQLTEWQLAKFASVPGIAEVYRHGPVSIYDMKGLGVPQVRSGWFGETPQIRMTTQLAVGLLCGLLIAAVMRSRAGPRITGSVRRWRESWGPSLTGAALLAGATVASNTLLFLGVWLTPLTIGAGVAVVVLVNLGAVLAVIRRGAGRITWPMIGSVALIAVPLGIVAALAIYSAATETVIEVDRILNDPAAVHVATNGARS